MNRIIVVEHDPHITHLLTRDLTYRRFRVIHASSRGGAFDNLRAFEPDLVVISTKLLRADFSEHMQFFLFALILTLLITHHQARFNSSSCFTSYSITFPSGITRSVSGRR